MLRTPNVQLQSHPQGTVGLHPTKRQGAPFQQQGEKATTQIMPARYCGLLRFNGTILW
jgi:hypothetical protein